MSKEPDLFFRIRKVEKDHPTDQYDGYQVEIARNDNGKWKKINYKNADILQIALSRIEMLMLDPKIALEGVE